MTKDKFELTYLDCFILAERFGEYVVNKPDGHALTQQNREELAKRLDDFVKEIMRRNADQEIIGQNQVVARSILKEEE